MQCTKVVPNGTDNDLFQSRERGTVLQIFHMQEEEFSFCNSHNGSVGASRGPDPVNQRALFYSHIP